jgi:hypothetical protein
VPSVSVVIPFRSDDPERIRIFDWTLARWYALHPEWQIVTPHDDRTEGPFNRSHAVNRGVEMADGNVMVIADADTAVRHGQAHEAVGRLHGSPWVVGYETMCHLTPQYTGLILDLPSDVKLADGLSGPNARSFLRWWSTESVCGLVALRRDDYLAIGGNDTRFEAWGWEETSFAHKADTFLGPHLRSSGDCVHLFHALRPDRKTDAHAEANRALGARYEAAAGDPDAMTVLAREALRA